MEGPCSGGMWLKGNLSLTLISEDAKPLLFQISWVVWLLFLIKVGYASPLEHWQTSQCSTSILEMLIFFFFFLVTKYWKSLRPIHYCIGLSRKQIILVFSLEILACQSSQNLLDYYLLGFLFPKYMVQDSNINIHLYMHKGNGYFWNKLCLVWFMTFKVTQLENVLR